MQSSAHKRFLQNYGGKLPKGADSFVQHSYGRERIAPTTRLISLYIYIYIVYLYIDNS